MSAQIQAEMPKPMPFFGLEGDGQIA